MLLFLFIIITRPNLLCNQVDMLIISDLRKVYVSQD